MTENTTIERPYHYIERCVPPSIQQWKAVAKPFLNINRIFPTKQKYIARMIDEAKKDANIKRIIIFGSTVLARCNLWSDIDIFFDCEKEPTSLPSIKDHEQAFDKFTNFGISNSFLEEIMKKGVVVYER